MNEQTPAPFDPALYLIEQANRPAVPQTFRPPAAPSRRLGAKLWEHFGRLAPGLATTSMSGLAWSWNLSTPGTDAAPLWVTGSLALLVGGAGCVAAAKPNGDSDTVRVSFAGAATLALSGVTAWTSDWQLAALLWTVSTAAVYAVCAPLWRADRREARAQEHEQVMEKTRGANAARVAAIEGSATVAAAQWEYRQEQAKVQAIVEAANVRQHRQLQPGQELDVPSLVKAARIELN